MKHIHFLGAGGTGASSVASIALAKGYTISGCDTNPDSKYATLLKDKGIPVLNGHDPAHLDGVDIVAASPAVINAKTPHHELLAARERGILMSWQEFIGNVLMKGMTPIAVAGTHGKTTTTALLGLTLEQANLDPTVMVGGAIAQWGDNARIGKSKYFVCEADEFNYNFINYRPRLAVLNNVEYEHPEYFANRDAYFAAFQDFITTMPDGATLVANLEDEGVVETLHRARHFITNHGVRVLGYGTTGRTYSPLAKQDLVGEVTAMDAHGITFDVRGIVNARDIRLSIYGRHNVANALGVILAAQTLGVPLEAIRTTFSTFSGIDRRLQLIHSDKNSDGTTTTIYDDYGHHPTEIGSTLRAVREHFPDKKLVAIVEPHMISRINTFAPLYAEALAPADSVFITRVFLGREAGKTMPDMEALCRIIGAEKTKFHPDFHDTIDAVMDEDINNAAIIVFGAGNSLQLSRALVGEINLLKTPLPHPFTLAPEPEKH